MRKRIWFLLFSLLCVILLTSQAFAESGTAGDLTWTLEKGVLTVNGPGRFPAKGPWMEYAKKIKEIEIGDEITGVDNSAIAGLPVLTSIHFGTGIDQIGYAVISDVPKLKRIRFSGPLRGLGLGIRAAEIIIDHPDALLCVDGDYVTDVSNRTTGFYAIGSLKGTVVVPKTFASIAMYSFNNMKNMKAVLLPEGFWSNIGDYAFKNCTGLTSITIPVKTNGMFKGVFSGCKALKQVIFLGPKVNLKETFRECSGIQEVVLPATDRLDSGFFQDCTALKRAVIAEGTGEIQKSIFTGCSRLTSVYLPESLTSIDEEAFDPSLTKLVFQCRAGSYAESYLQAHGLKYEVIRPIESIALNESEVSLDAGKSLQLKAEVLPADATSPKALLWGSSNEQVLSVKDGKIKGLQGGECDLYCITADGSNLRAVCHVSVHEKIRSLQAGEKKHSLPVGETWQAMVTIKPETATNRILVWNSSDESVCTVNETGLVTAVGKGKCILICEATDGSRKSVKINITVTEE